MFPIRDDINGDDSRSTLDGCLCSLPLLVVASSTLSKT